jgi:oxygen-independent coproporphyrinogen III oxidase
MYDIPDMSLDIWKNTLLQAVLLPITHISIYNLEIEPKTAWYRLKSQLAAKMPTQDESLLMYQVAVSTLREHHFEQYEISAFSKNSQRSLHNVGYWIGREFLGLGPAAFSYFQKIRFSNVEHLDQYSFCMANGQSPILPESITSTKEELKEFLAIGLRMNDGVHFTSLQDRFGYADNQLLSTIQHLVHIELLSQDGDCLRLTEKGRLVYDAIASEII